MSWWAIAALAGGTYVLKAAGPVLAGGRELPPTADRLIALLPASLLAALVAVQTLSVDGRLVIDARAAGVGVAALAAWRGAGFLAIVALAVATTALVRLLGG